MGRSIVLNGVSHTVVGIMPPRFDFPNGAAFWTPLSNQLDPKGRSHGWLAVRRVILSSGAASAADASGLVQTALSKVTRRSHLELDACARAPGHSR